MVSDGWKSLKIWLKYYAYWKAAVYYIWCMFNHFILDPYAIWLPHSMCINKNLLETTEYNVMNVKSNVTWLIMNALMVVS